MPNPLKEHSPYLSCLIRHPSGWRRERPTWSVVHPSTGTHQATVSRTRQMQPRAVLRLSTCSKVGRVAQPPVTPGRHSVLPSVDRTPLCWLPSSVVIIERRGLLTGVSGVTAVADSKNDDTDARGPTSAAILVVLEVVRTATALVAANLITSQQRTLTDHRTSGERPSKRGHYLVGTVRCGGCALKLLFTVVTGRNREAMAISTVPLAAMVANRVISDTCHRRSLKTDVEQQWLSETVPTEDLALARQDIEASLSQHETEAFTREQLLNRQISGYKA